MSQQPWEENDTSQWRKGETLSRHSSICYNGFRLAAVRIFSVHRTCSGITAFFSLFGQIHLKGKPPQAERNIRGKLSRSLPLLLSKFLCCRNTTFPPKHSVWLTLVGKGLWVSFLLDPLLSFTHQKVEICFTWSRDGKLLVCEKKRNPSKENNFPSKDVLTHARTGCFRIESHSKESKDQQQGEHSSASANAHRKIGSAWSSASAPRPSWKREVVLSFLQLTVVTWTQFFGRVILVFFVVLFAKSEVTTPWANKLLAQHFVASLRRCLWRTKTFQGSNISKWWLNNTIFSVHNSFQEQEPFWRNRHVGCVTFASGKHIRPFLGFPRLDPIQIPKHLPPGTTRRMNSCGYISVSTHSVTEVTILSTGNASQERQERSFRRHPQWDINFTLSLSKVLVPNSLGDVL